MSQPWKVLFVTTSSDFGGTESFLAALAAGLDRTRFAPSVCSLRPAGRAARQLVEAGVPVTSLEMSERVRPLEMVRAWGALRRAIDQGTIDLVQPLLYRANVLAAWAARWSRQRPVVVGGQRSLQPLTGKGAEWAARRSRHLCHRIVAVSSAVRDELVRHDRVAAARIVVIPNGVDTARFQPGDRRAARAALGLANDAFVLGSVGRLSPEKGFDVLLAAATELRREVPALQVVVAGDGPQREQLQEQAAALGIGSAVHWLGRRDDPQALYPAFDLFVLPSLEEGAPNALLEAMACGVCAVASRVGGVPEMLADGREGRLVAPGSPAALSAVLSELATQPVACAKLAQAARARVLAEHDLRHTLRRHSELYTSLLEEAGLSERAG